MDSISRLIGGFETWWIVATATMWVFAGLAIHWEVKSRRNRIFFYLVLGVAIIGFFLKSFIDW